MRWHHRFTCDRSAARRAALIVAVLLSATPVLAQETEQMEPQFPQQQSAADLLRACASSRLTASGRERRRYCTGFVAGVEEAERVLHPGSNRPRTFCTPADVTASALADAFVRYGAGHASEQSEPAARVVLRALEQAWPCKAVVE